MILRQLELRALLLPKAGELIDEVCHLLMHELIAITEGNDASFSLVTRPVDRLRDCQVFEELIGRLAILEILVLKVVIFVLFLAKLVIVVLKHQLRR